MLDNGSRNGHRGALGFTQGLGNSLCLSCRKTVPNRLGAGPSTQREAEHSPTKAPRAHPGMPGCCQTTVWRLTADATREPQGRASSLRLAPSLSCRPGHAASGAGDPRPQSGPMMVPTPRTLPPGSRQRRTPWTVQRFKTALADAQQRAASRSPSTTNTNQLAIGHRGRPGPSSSRRRRTGKAPHLSRDISLTDRATGGVESRQR